MYSHLRYDLEIQKTLFLPGTKKKKKISVHINPDQG